MSLLGGIVSSIVGRPSKLQLPPTPEYYTDPNFTGTQDFLKKYSENMLQGNIPDFYKSIGMTSDQAAGAGLMNDYVSQATKDLVNRDLEAGALTGRGRTGLSSNALATAGAQGGALRYADYLRAMQGKMDLLNTGLAQEGGVRGAAMQDMTSKNAFDKWKYGADVTSQQLTNASANARRAYNADAINNIDSQASQAATAAIGGGGFDMATFLQAIMGVSSPTRKMPVFGQGEGVTSSDFGLLTPKNTMVGSGTMLNGYLPMMGGI